MGKDHYKYKKEGHEPLKHKANSFLAQWLRRDLQIAGKGRDGAEGEQYNKIEGLVLQWDYLMHLRNVKKVQIVYGIYRRGIALYEARLVDLVRTQETGDPNYCTALFDSTHQVREISPGEETYVVVEIQVPNSSSSDYHAPSLDTAGGIPTRQP